MADGCCSASSTSTCLQNAEAHARQHADDTVLPPRVESHACYVTGGCQARQTRALHSRSAHVTHHTHLSCSSRALQNANKRWEQGGRGAHEGRRFTLHARALALRPPSVVSIEGGEWLVQLLTFDARVARASSGQKPCFQALHIGCTRKQRARMHARVWEFQICETFVCTVTRQMTFCVQSHVNGTLLKFVCQGLHCSSLPRPPFFIAPPAAACSSPLQKPQITGKL